MVGYSLNHHCISAQNPICILRYTLQLYLLPGIVHDMGLILHPQFRDYNFGGGLEGKFESSLNFDKWATATLAAYYYWTHSYIGLKEDNLLAIIKPRIAIRIINNLSVGYEQAFYSNNIHSPDLPILHINRTEQKIFLMLYLEDKQRRGHYN